MGCNTHGQRLVDGDLFVINRPTLGGADTFKITANDIGLFLSGQTVHDKFVNDGPINVYGYSSGAELNSSITLHSANEPCEGMLRFSDSFNTTGVTHNVKVALNFSKVAQQLTFKSSTLKARNSSIEVDIDGFLALLGLEAFSNVAAATAAGLGAGDIYYDRSLKKLRAGS